MPPSRVASVRVQNVRSSNQASVTGASLSFNHPGPVSAIAFGLSDASYSPAYRRYTRVTAGLKVAGSTSTVIEVNVNGNPVLNGILIAEVTIPDGERAQSEPWIIEAESLEPIQIRVIEAGTGADGLFVVLEP